jgi:predicted Ser/Thr protein kinase
LSIPVAGRFGRFTIQSELGRGAMGVVYTAMHPGLGVPVAIKVLAETYSKDANFRTRFQREASTVASLNHPGIVRVYDFDVDGDALFIVMEFVEGRSLRYWLNHSGRFRVDVALDLIQQLLSAVGAAHVKGIVHRDLKPDNVLVSTQGKTKILDFGIAKWMGEVQGLTATGAMVGTPAYMAPEQIKGEDLDHRADVYALGCMFYELLHGEPPFTGSMPNVLHSQVFSQPRPSTAVPDNLFHIVLKAMAKDPRHRFQSCEEFAGALLLTARPDINKPSSPPPNAPPPQPATTLKTLLGAALNRMPAPPHSGEASAGCSYGGCSATEGWACAYVDATGVQCSTWWCRRHVVFVDAVPFCPRHSNVLRALAATAGTIREIKHRPDVNDRALPLAALVAEDVDRDLTELIRRRFKGRQGVRLAHDTTIRQVWEGRGHVAWERSWSALKDQGYLTRIAVRVTGSEPDTVKVAIGQTIVLSAVPDWISRRREGEPPDPADRARFRARVIEAVLEHIDTPSPRPSGAMAAVHPSDSPAGAPKLDLGLAEGLVLRVLASTSRMTAFEIGERMAVPFLSIEPALNSLTVGNLIDSLGIAGNGAANRPLPERMAYAMTVAGRGRMESMPGSRYLGPAPVSLQELHAALKDASRPTVLTELHIAKALGGLEVSAGVMEAVRAAVNSHGSLFLYGSPGNGKTSLARRVVALLGDPILVPVAVDLGGGDVMRIFDPSTHRLSAVQQQPADQRWRRVERPLIQVGGEFLLDMLEPTWESASKSYEAPLQVKAAGGVLLIDDLGRQKVPPKAILDRLLVPLEQHVDYLNLSAAGRKVEIQFEAQVILSTNLRPAELLDEAYLRRLAYKVLMPDPTWDAWVRIFDHERERLNIEAEPRALDLIKGLYGARPLRGNHPRDLLDRLVDVAAARGMKPELRPDLIQAAWQTLFVAS